jgi:hypothetical protein
MGVNIMSGNGPREPVGKDTPKKKAKAKPKPKGFIAPGYKRDRYGRVVRKSAADYAFDRAEAAKKKARKRKSKGDKKAKRTYNRYRKGGRKGGR